MKRATPLVLVVGGVCVGCAGTSDSTTTNVLRVESIRLTADTISSAPVLGQLTGILLAGSTLWVGDRAENPALHAIDTVTHSLVRSVGRPGSGPGDIPRVSTLSVDATDRSAIWVGSTGRKMTRITDSSYRANASSAFATFTFNSTGAQWAYSLAGGRFVGNAFRDSATIVVFDSTGRVFSTIDIPYPGGDDVSLQERSRALQGSGLCVDRGGTMLAMWYRHEARIDFYSAELKHTASAAVPFPYQARFDTSSLPRPPVLGRPDTGFTGKVFIEGRLNYSRCAFSDQHLFALYSGKTAADESADEPACCRFVHVFDFSGRLVRILDLGVSVIAIAVTPSGERIFAPSAWTESIVYGLTVPASTTR